MIGNAKDALERLHRDYDALKANDLFQTLMKECVLRSRSFKDEAGRVTSDRDMNRTFGKSDAYGEVPVMVGEVVDALDEFYNRMIEREAVEDGRTGTEGDRGQGYPGSNPTTAEIKKRKSLFADDSDL